jgi:signal transduction histidine kinase
MTKKLLYKTVQSYLLFSILILGIAVPAFYYTAQKLYELETDETLELHLKEFETTVLPKLSLKEIDNWNQYNRDVKIEPSLETIAKKLFTQFYYDTLDDENEPYRVLQAPIQMDGKNFSYSSKINLIESEDLFKSIFLLFLIVIFALLIGLLVITKIRSQKLWKPFNETLEQIEHFEIDKHQKPSFATTNTDEFNRLNQSVYKLIEKNIAIFQNQREFIENAAHELQTPLAVFKAKIDTLFQLENITTHQAAILTELNNDIARLNRLNKNLLLLSKIENETYTQKQEINITEIFENQLPFFEEQALGKNIQLSTSFEQSIFISSNLSLVEILIQNLLLNAIKHNIKDGMVAVYIANNLLTITNTGTTQALPSDKLFERFSKANPSEQGNGLGLAIIKKIIAVNNWQITYEFNHGKHTFTIIL